MKSIIVTGGTYGIGKGISVGLSRRGYGVVAFGVSIRTARQLGGKRNREIADRSARTWTVTRCS